MNDEKDLRKAFANLKDLKKKLSALEANLNDIKSSRSKYRFNLDEMTEDTYVSLSLGLEIAGCDLRQGNKTEFTFDEAKEIEKNLPDGWRLPSPQEWTYIAAKYGYRKGVYDYDTFVENLNLTVNMSSSGNYWSSAVGSNNFGYYLNFYAGGVLPQDSSYRHYGLSVRLVRNLLCYEAEE